MKYTEEQITLIRESWETMKEMGMQELGLLIFHKLLKESPFIQTLFYNIEIMPGKYLRLEDMRRMRKVKSHATSIALSITKYVDYLDNPSEMEKLLKELGDTHARKGVDPKFFEYLQPVILFVIGERLNIPASSPTILAWDECFTGLRSGITERMKGLANNTCQDIH